MAGMVAGGLFNAVAFAGAGFLFSKLNHRGYEGETKRHNKAIEDLAKAKQLWYEKEVARKNKIEKKRRELDDANADINDTNQALKSLRKLLEEQDEPEPTLQNYYKPSKEMRKYKIMAAAVIGVGSGFVVYEVYKVYKRPK